LQTVRDVLEGDEVNHQLLKKADYAGNTAVHLAAVGPEPEVLWELLVRGASVHARNRADNTALWLAEKIGNAECVRLLREAGAHLWPGERSGVPSTVPSKAPSVAGDSGDSDGEGTAEGRIGVLDEKLKAARDEVEAVPQQLGAF
jgi:lysophospholipase